MKSIAKTIYVVSLIAFNGALLYGVYFLVIEASKALSELSPEFVTVVATAVLSGLTVLGAKHWELRIEIARHLREKKSPIYESLIQFFLFRMLYATKLGKEPPDEQEVMEFMSKHTTDLIVWGGDEVLTKFVAFRNVGIVARGDATDVEPNKMLVAVADLLLAIRKDLGHSNRRIGQERILNTFIDEVPLGLDNLK